MTVELPLGDGMVEYPRYSSANKGPGRLGRVRSDNFTHLSAEGWTLREG